MIYFIGVVGLNSLFIILAWRYRTAAAVSVVLLALLIIPYQVLLGQRLLRVQAETTQIVAFAFEQKAQSGAFPSDLSNYTFHDADMKAYIQSYQLDEVGEQFTVFYRVGTESTSHWYSSETGWGYYPDWGGYDEDAYYDIKDPVYDLIWDAAQDWARQTGWTPL